MEEVAAGIYRIESDLGPRFMAQYLVVGDERSVLVDTGLAGTPDAVLPPALENVGIEPDLILVSHADLDHCGGNRRMRERFPRALFACHELDRGWIESNAALLAENYLWHEPYGLDEPNEAERREMLAEMGGDSPVDLGLRGGETFRIAPGRRLELLHLPGHTHGHIGVWDSDTRIAIVIDAALADGIRDRMGNKLIPPRYYDADAYRQTIRRIRALEPELLLTAHFVPMPKAEAREFCESSLAYVDAVEAIVRAESAGGETSLRRLTERVNKQLAPSRSSRPRSRRASARTSPRTCDLGAPTPGRREELPTASRLGPGIRGFQTVTVEQTWPRLGRGTRATVLAMPAGASRGRRSCLPGRRGRARSWP
jgi:glyoxylase-like metal-dependent hydrolase (beta-lactamase superfamily II)